MAILIEAEIDTCRQDTWRPGPRGDDIIHSNFDVDSIGATITNQKISYSADGPSPSSHKYIRYDNCSSKKITNDLSLLYNIRKLPIPMSIYGINGRILLTHSGCFKYFPETNNINLTHHAKDINSSLLSLSYMQRHKCNYNTHDNDKKSIYLPNNILQPDMVGSYPLAIVTVHAPV